MALADIRRLSLNQMTVKQWSLPQAIEGCLRAQIPAVGIWREKVAEVGLTAAARHVRDAGLPVSSLCRGGWFDAATPAGRHQHLEENRRAIEEAAALGTDLLVLVCGPAATRDLVAARAYVAEAIAALVPYAAQHGVRLGIEPMHPMYVAERSVIVTLAQALDLAKRQAPEHVGIVVDSYHVWWDPAVMPGLAAAGERIFGLHLADWLVPTPDMLNGRGMLGDGVIDLSAIRQAADHAGYSGYIEVEIFNPDLWQLDGDVVLRLLIERYLAVA